MDTAATVLTERQLTVLERREAGATQQTVADELGPTASNVSAIERAAEDNIEKARRTLELVRTLRGRYSSRSRPGSPSARSLPLCTTTATTVR